MNVRILCRKTFRFLLSLLLFSVLLYGLLYLSTGDPAISLLRKSGTSNITTDALNQTRQALGLDQTFFVQYFRWLLLILQGNFGLSYMSGEPVLQTMIARSAITVTIIGWSFVINLLISLVAGTLIANSPVLRKGRSILVVCLSFPSYWIAIVCIFIFGVQLQWFPFVGSGTASHLVLPILVCMLSEGLYLIKIVSDLLSVSAESDLEWIAKRRRIPWLARRYYQINDNMVPLIALYANSLIRLFSITIMVEVIFSISGISKLLIDAISVRDYPMIQGVGLVIASIVFLINYLSDVLVLLCDERVMLHQGENL
ncbi:MULTISPECIES: ABC transporter permease [unclassified Enterococcus]|uniref:ABC transporter permease n=1 Tax=unclassified Enterococcus TaxID=2608891 RepID=UPI0019081C2E|nr:MULTISPECIES: ABC transporter permease [unclassified Enterococcus]MBK0038791.1 ABC transporter permease subunit [Enterococcus sp. S52]MBK0071808.1 ABC transporter permease subunit [Enterococcus sp. S53]MBK0142069.1 ABC transporter permease subunit [Enterococcus sp. S76]MBK0145788.1 ABC transporter permease subunit [Enterococcus sp. S77]